MAEISNVPPKDIGLLLLFQKLSALKRRPGLLETDGRTENENIGLGASHHLPPVKPKVHCGHLCSVPREERQGRDSPAEPPRECEPINTLILAPDVDFGPLVPRMTGEQISAVLSHRVCVGCYSSHRK